jgi:hypothetical protein
MYNYLETNNIFNSILSFFSRYTISPTYVLSTICTNDQEDLYLVEGSDNGNTEWSGSDSVESVAKKPRLSDIPLVWGLYFQDGASPSFEGIVDLHNRIMFYLVVILFGVTWIMLSIMWNFNKSHNKLVYRYLNHGRFVPIQKCFKFNNTWSKIFLRTYTTLPNKTLDSNISNNVIKTYENALYEKNYFKRKQR